MLSQFVHVNPPSTPIQFVSVLFPRSRFPGRCTSRSQVNGLQSTTIDCIRFIHSFLIFLATLVLAVCCPPLVTRLLIRCSYLGFSPQHNRGSRVVREMPRTDFVSFVSLLPSR